VLGDELKAVVNGNVWEEGAVSLDFPIVGHGPFLAETVLPNRKLLLYGRSIAAGDSVG
jgi:hypothetical protein